MGKFDEMSDFEVNKKLALLIINSLLWVPYCAAEKRGEEILSKDYCNNWSDIGPLIEKHEVTIEFDASESGSHRWCNTRSIQGGSPVDYSKNPKRAAAICIIMKLEAENG